MSRHVFYSAVSTALRFLFFSFAGLSNQGQSNLAKAFPQTPNDAKSVGLRFVDQAGSRDPRSNALFDVNGHGINGSSFYRSGRLKLQNEDPRSNALFDVNGREISVVFVL